MFEEWAAENEKRTILVTQERVTPEGRTLHVGDRITRDEARRLKLPLIEAEGPHHLETK